jgi:hypothetical protein
VFKSVLGGGTVCAQLKVKGDGLGEGVERRGWQDELLRVKIEFDGGYAGTYRTCDLAYVRSTSRHALVITHPFARARFECRYDGRMGVVRVWSVRDICKRRRQTRQKVRPLGSWTPP